MDLFSDLIAAVQSDLTIGDESSLLPLSTVKLAINRANRKATGLFAWPMLEDSKKTSTINGQEYYDYPDNWRPSSIWKLRVDGNDYGEPLVFEDYLYEQENNYPSGRTKLWGNQWLRYFITPVPTADGNSNIEIWGQKIADALVNNTDTTIFSYNMPECNEAIVLEAVAILKYKGEIEQPVMRSFIGGVQLLNMEAQNTLTIAFNRVKQNMARYQKTKPFFQVPDFFGRSNKKTTIGDFD